MFQVVVGGTFPLVLGKLLHMAVKAEVQSCQLFLHLPHVFELLKGAYFTWKSDRLNQTWIWWRSVSCLVITSKSKVFPWQQRRKKNSTACIWFQPDSCNKATFHSPLFSASNRILSWGGGHLIRLPYQKLAVCLSGSHWGGWVGLPPSLSHLRHLWGRSAAGGTTGLLYWALLAGGPWASPCGVWQEKKQDNIATIYFC